MSTDRLPCAEEEQEDAALAPSSDEAVEQVPAWEQIENGRYQPRRIRGSCRGRELG